VTRPTVLFLGGNGHDPVRLEGVRGVLSAWDAPFDILELTYPRASTYDELLDALEASCAQWESEQAGGLVYATGIGGLVALSLRARGALAEHPLIIQGAVLWGLERRWFPRIMRLPGMPQLLTQAFRSTRIQKRFKAHHLLTEPTLDWSKRFFAGYGDAEAFASWFRWLTPALLRRLEREIPARTGALADVVAWWGQHDSVVSAEELRLTERALGVQIPLRTFAGWGHYPMIDDPEDWVAEVRDVLETAGAIS
jgi:pimeloyl-ACP methyl ester carboxylesterase